MLSKKTGSRKLTVTEYRTQLLAAPPRIRLVKLCDRLDNLLSLRSCPDSAKVRRYLTATEEFYAPLGRATDEKLLAVILDVVRILQLELSPAH